jgi:hypothetical protein
MKTVSYTDARNQLASLMEAANADRLRKGLAEFKAGKFKKAPRG